MTVAMAIKMTMTMMKKKTVTLKTTTIKMTAAMKITVTLMMTMEMTVMRYIKVITHPVNEITIGDRVCYNLYDRHRHCHRRNDEFGLNITIKITRMQKPNEFISVSEGVWCRLYTWETVKHYVYIFNVF